MRTHAEAVVADLLLGAFAPLPEMTDDWNAKAARAVTRLRKDHPRAVIAGFTKWKPN